METEYIYFFSMLNNPDFRAIAPGALRLKAFLKFSPEIVRFPLLVEKVTLFVTPLLPCSTENPDTPVTLPPCLSASSASLDFDHGLSLPPQQDLTSSGKIPDASPPD